MSVDEKAFLEHWLDDEWVLIDVDPMNAADRNSRRREKLNDLAQTGILPNISKGVAFWLNEEGAPQFIACIPIEEAAFLWHETETNPELKKMNVQDLDQLTLNYFGLWQVQREKWRIIVAI